MLSTIQPMGSRPVKAPIMAALPAMAPGMPNTKMAISKALTRPRPAAMWAFMWRKPSPISITATGITASSVDSSMLSVGL